MTYKLFDVVVLKTDVKSHGLMKGRRGTIVHVFSKPRVAFEVEFVDENGGTVAQLTLTPEQLENS